MKNIYLVAMLLCATFSQAFYSGVELDTESNTGLHLSVTLANPSLPITSVSGIETTAPTGSTNQTFCSNALATISNIVVNGTNIKWYSTPDGGSELPTNTNLTNGNTYFASQTVDGSESNSRLGVRVTIVDPVAPTGTAIQSLCSAATIAGLEANGTGIKWYAVATGGTALDPSTSITTGVAYYATQTIGGCESDARLTVAVNEFIMPHPIVGVVTQPTCSVATGSVELTGLPSFGNWIITASGSGTTITGSGTSATFPGLTSGTYTFALTNSEGCVSPQSDVVIIHSPQSPPAQPSVESITQPTCKVPTGTIVFNPQSNVEYSIGSEFQASRDFNNLTSGIYTLSVRSTSDTSCITTSAAAVVIKAVPSAPSIPTVASTIQPTCAIPTGTIVFDTQVNAEYSVGSGFQASPIFSGLASGIYTLSVRSTTDNTCTTNAITKVTIDAIQTAPFIPSTFNITQPSCGVTTGVIEFNAQSGVEFSVGGAFQDSPVFSGLVPGTYTLTVRSISDLSCSTDGESTITINETTSIPTTPMIGTIDQPTCSLSTGSVELFNLPFGNWVIRDNFDGANYFGSGTTFVLTGLAQGIHSFQVTDQGTGCISSISAQMTISGTPSGPAVPTILNVVQPICESLIGTIEFNTQSGVEYSIGSEYQTSPKFSRVGTGTYTLSVRSTTDKACITKAESTVTINESTSAPSAPTVGLVTQPTCSVATGSVELNGLPFDSWTITETVSRMTKSGSGTSFVYTNLVAGQTYDFTVTTSEGCVSSPSILVSINEVPNKPTEPTVLSITQPVCGLLTGTIEIDEQLDVEYSIGSEYQANSKFSEVVAGTYTLSVRSTADNSCITTAASTVTINEATSIPNAPIIDAVVQATCSVATGSVNLSGLPVGNWTIQNNFDGFNQTGSGTTFTLFGLEEGQHSFQVIDENGGCISVTSEQVIIAKAPSVPTIPTINVVDCSLGFGQAVVSVNSPLGADYEYSIDGGTYQASTSFSNVVNGSHTITTRFKGACTATTSSFSVSCGCIDGPTLNLSSISGATCGVNPITISNNVFGGSSNGGDTVDVIITSNGAGSFDSTNFMTSPFSFTYTPDATDFGKDVIINVTTDNPNGAPCVPAISTYILTVSNVVVAPTGLATQNFCESKTVADLIASGTDIKWYLLPIGGDSMALTTALIDGNTYYASQTTGNCESIDRLAVKVSLNCLGTNNYNKTLSNIEIHPNPVQNTLNFDTIEQLEILSISVYNVNGQLLINETSFENNSIDVSILSKGVYVVVIKTKKENISRKFIKE